MNKSELNVFINNLAKEYNINIIPKYDGRNKRATCWKISDYFTIIYGKDLINDDEYEQIRTVYHELGHCVYDMSYRTIKQKEEAEFQAERFALDKLKELYPEIYKWRVNEGINELLDEEWASNRYYIHYRRAWKRIKEYNKC